MFVGLNRHEGSGMAVKEGNATECGQPPCPFLIVGRILLPEPRSIR